MLDKSDKHFVGWKILSILFYWTKVTKFVKVTKIFFV